jgi:hypothetical protein
MAHADDATLIALLAEDASRGDIEPLVACFRQRYGRRRAHAILVHAAELLARAARRLAPEVPSTQQIQIRRPAAPIRRIGAPYR